MALSPARSFQHRLALGKSGPRSLLRSKDLDFLLLTGCSCLITLLHHPMVNHLQTANGSTNVKGSNPASTSHSHSPSSNTSQNSLGSYSAVVPKRQSFSIEDDET